MATTTPVEPRHHCAATGCVCSSCIGVMPDAPCPEHDPLAGLIGGQVGPVADYTGPEPKPARRHCPRCGTFTRELGDGFHRCRSCGQTWG